MAMVQIKFAVMIVAVLPILLLYPFLQKIFRQGCPDRRPEGVDPSRQSGRAGKLVGGPVANHRTTERRKENRDEAIEDHAVLGAVLTLVAAGAFGAGTEEGMAPGELPTLTRGHAHRLGRKPGACRATSLPVYQELERLSGVHIEWENIQVKQLRGGDEARALPPPSTCPT